MYKETLKFGIKNNIVEIQFKSLDFDFDKLLQLYGIKNIIEKIEKRLTDKKGKFFIFNFETCINWRII